MENEVKKNPRFEDDSIHPLDKPDEKKIVCRDCKFREADRFNGKIKGSTLAMCEKYHTKPSAVLWDNADCEEWESEEDIFEEI